MFPHVDIIFISSGVNDVSRHDRTSRYLSDFMSDKLSQWAELYPDKTFIMNSILASNREDINRHLEMFNDSMFRLSLHLDKFLFLDTYEALVDSSFRVLQPKGVHLTDRAREHIIPVIRSAILKVATDPRLIGDWQWPLRPHYRQWAITHYQWFGK